MITVEDIDNDAGQYSGPSKSQRKREMTALQDLGGELVALSKERLAKIDMPERLRDALAELSSALNERASEAASAVSRASSELRTEKVGREDLSALLTELALRLKGEFELPSR